MEASASSKAFIILRPGSVCSSRPGKYIPLAKQGCGPLFCRAGRSTFLPTTPWTGRADDCQASGVLRGSQPAHAGH